MSREAFAEVQKKLVDHQKQYRHLQQQQQTQHREALQAKLTADELEKLSDAPVYKAIGAPFFFCPAQRCPARWPAHAARRGAGRMFMLAEKAEVVSDLNAVVKKGEERLTVMVNTQNYLEKQMEDCQKSLQEMAMANPTGEDQAAGGEDEGDD